MSNWFEPLQDHELGGKSEIQWLASVFWFPCDAAILMSKHRSMESRLIKLVIEHINKFMRKCITRAQVCCLTLDGHSSREGLDLLEYAQEVICEIIELLSDTSHFLQG